VVVHVKKTETSQADIAWTDFRHMSSAEIRKMTTEEVAACFDATCIKSDTRQAPVPQAAARKEPIGFMTESVLQVEGSKKH
jgi:hypothetical protein